MNKTTLFLICLIVPIAFAQQDILSMLDKTPEGKQVLNHLFIQTKLMGQDLDVEVLRNFLRENRNRITSVKSETEGNAATQVAECEKDAEDLKAILGTHHERELGIKRVLDANKRKQESFAVKAERVQEELDNYNKFAAFVKRNRDSWEEFLAVAFQEIEAVEEILGSFLKLAQSVPAHGSSFVQLPKKFSTTLSQIKLKVQSTNVDFYGMGPIISNMMEIMQVPENVNKPAVLAAVRSLVDSLLETVKDKRDQYERMAEFQKTYFDSMQNAYEQNSKRSQDEAASLSEVVAALSAKVDAISQSADHAQYLTAQVDAILSGRLEECRDYKVNAADTTVRTEKVLSAISQLEDILLTKTQGLQSYFIQRQMKTLK